MRREVAAEIVGGVVQIFGAERFIAHPRPRLDEERILAQSHKLHLCMQMLIDTCKRFAAPLCYSLADDPVMWVILLAELDAHPPMQWSSVTWRAEIGRWRWRWH